MSAASLRNGDLLQHLVAEIAVLAHDGDFFRARACRLAQDCIGNGHLSDVVQERAAGNHVNLISGSAHGAGDGDGECGDALGVAFGLGILEVERIAQGFQSDVVGALQFGDGGCAVAWCEPADQRFQIGLVGAVLQLQAPILQGAANRVQQLLALERFQQVVVGAVADRAPGPPKCRARR